MTSKKEYSLRRAKLAKKLPKNSVAIIPAASEILRNGDAHFRFRQDSDFYYLTGFNEPDALLVITTGAQNQSLLFNLPKDPTMERWTGYRLGQDDAPSTLGVDDAFSIERLEQELMEVLSNQDAIYLPIGRYPKWEQRIRKIWLKLKEKARQGIKAPLSFCDVTPILSELRLFKSESEIHLMRKAVDISISAHKKAMQASAFSQFEYQLEAELYHEFFRQGCRSAAYDPIVAGGANACVLHYTANNQPLRQGDLVLIDAGGEYGNYAADITRTYPINGKFSPEQKALYELVLRAQKVGIEQVKPGAPWDKVQEVMVQVITEGLVELKILKGRVDDLIAEGAYKAFYMHSSGHWLGLDVHDSGAYKVNNAWRVFEPGMVLTVEPGLYMSPETEGLDERWQGIGIRIEDDILVTKANSENLSKHLPVEIAALEELVCG